MDYKIKPDGYKTVYQWKQEGKEPINEEVIEEYYASNSDGSLFLVNGKPVLHNYVSPSNVRTIIPPVLEDSGNEHAFRDELYFLSNMFPCSVRMTIGGRTYNFPSSENAYQACKNEKYASEFLNISPYQAKEHGKTIPLRPDWDEVKESYMKQVLYCKFQQNHELLIRLTRCNFQIEERNNWGDTYWGICNGEGKNVLGNLLQQIKCEYLNIPYVSSQENSIAIGKRMLEKQQELSLEYAYKKLPSPLSLKVRKEYGKYLPDFYLRDSNKKKPIFTRDGIQIAKKWNRIVIGDYGAFVEIDPKDICEKNLMVRPGQEYRVNDRKYLDNVKFHWYIPKSGSESKLYFQQKGVTYADYKPNMWYVSPYETQEGQLITNHREIEVSNTVEKSVSQDLLDALNTPIQRLDLENKTIVFDTETTGRSNSAEILQITIMDGDGKMLLDTYVCPLHTKEWPQAMEVNHITPDKVKDAPNAISLAPKIRDIFASADKIVGYNVSFDLRMVKQSFGIEIPKEKVIDLLPVFKKQFPDGSHKLEDAVRVYCPQLSDEYFSDAHSSSTDTLATVYVYQKQMEIQNQNDKESDDYLDEYDSL